MGWFDSNKDEEEIKIENLEEEIQELKIENKKFKQQISDNKYPILESISSLQTYSGPRGYWLTQKFYKIGSPEECDKIIEEVNSYRNIFKTLYTQNIINRATWENITNGVKVFDYIRDFCYSVKCELEKKKQDESDARETT